MLSDAFDKVVVSIDGDKDEHDLRRGKGTYDRTVANIMAFNENDQGILNKTQSGRLIKIAISAALRAEDIYSDKRAQMAQLARILNVGKVTLRTILPIGRAANYNKPLEFIPLEMYEGPQKVLEDGFQPAATCGIGEKLYIEPTGAAFPCYAYNTPYALLGNAIMQSVKGIVESKKFKSFREHSVDTNSKCKVCDYRYICGGACRAWQSQEAQCDLDATSYDCSDLKKRVHGIYLAAMRYFR